ncbi:MAG TPA: exo-alpha-sialidase [Thermoplasmata archaeon]|nr:exo-alpha-sialidase [Thermoplasmata archaeon]
MAAKGKVTVYVGTRKGGYVVEGDRSRKKWKVSGPTQEGSEVFHMAPDPRSPGHVYSLANSAFFGPMVFRSTDYGRKWTEVGTPMMPRKKQRPPANFEYDPTTNTYQNTAKIPVKNLWHLEPGPADEPKTLFLGIDPANLYRSDDRGESWEPLPGLNEHATRPKWNPGAGGMCLHTILIDPTNSKRMHIGISAAGTFRTDDGGEHWKPTNKGVRVDFQPDKNPEVGQCVHDVVMDPSNPDVLYRQDHNGIHVSRDAADTWQRVGKSLPYDFGFVSAAPAASPGEAYFVPLTPNNRTTLPAIRVMRWTEKTRAWSPAMRGDKQFPGNFGTHREGMASDRLDPFGLYLGTTTGQLFVSANAAKTWSQVPFTFPSIHSVTVESPSAV